MKQELKQLPRDLGTICRVYITVCCVPDLIIQQIKNVQNIFHTKVFPIWIDIEQKSKHLCHKHCPEFIAVDIELAISQILYPARACYAKSSELQ